MAHQRIRGRDITADFLMDSDVHPKVIKWLITLAENDRHQDHLLAECVSMIQMAVAQLEGINLVAENMKHKLEMFERVKQDPTE